MTSTYSLRHLLDVVLLKMEITLFRVSEQVLVNDTYRAEALIDSGSTDKSFISSKLAKLLNVKIIPTNDVIRMASASLSAKSDGHCYVSQKVQES